MINRIEQFDERFGTLEIDDMRNADAHCAGQCGVLLCDADVPCPGLDSPDCDTDDPRSEIKSMDDYIRDHYERALVANLCQQIERGEVPPEDTRKRMWSTRVEAYPESGRISHITYIRLNQCCFHADILITVDLTIYRVEKGENTTARRTQWYRVEMEVDMETEASIDVGAFSIYRHIEHENACFLTEHLVPYFNTEKLEVEAERILSDYCPGVLCKATNINATDLAETMGLKIIHLPLYNQKKRESVLFFTDGEVLTQESDGAPIVPVRVNARTIVLNESNSSVMLGYTQDAIFHECVHYEEHFLFFRLQDMYCDDTSKLAKWRPRPNVPKEERKWGPVKSMEWQARFGGQFLRMPRTMVQGDAKKFLAETSKDSHNGIRMEKVICRLEDAYRVPRYRAKSRIIQLGFEAAKGAFNYVNDKRLRPFAFALGSS